MMSLFLKTLSVIIWFLIFSKIFLFWLWLWQLKEYHFGRFRAHFEAQKIKKLLASFSRLKLPKFTKKVIVIFSLGILLEISIFLYIASLSDFKFKLIILLWFIFSAIIYSLFILLFQIPTVILRNRLLKKARQRIEKLKKEKAKQGKELIVVGITGSYGKTSTKEFLYAILQDKFGSKVLKTAAHINSEIGIAQTILRELTDEHEIFIAEIGAYNKGKIKQVCKILQPKIGILTGINEQHMATFGSQENIIKAKFELIESLPEDGVALLNDNDPKIKNEKLKIKNCNPKLKNIKFISADFTDNIIRAIARNLLSWDRENFLMAVAAAEVLGVRQEEIEKAAGKIKSVLQIKKNRKGLNIIDSTYSANPSGVLAHLEYLKNWQQKKILVTSCLIELGKASKKVHYKIGEKIGKVCDLAIITTKDRFKYLKQGAVKSGMSEDNIVFMTKPKEILERISASASAGDVMLLESRISKTLVDAFLLASIRD